MNSRFLPLFALACLTACDCGTSDACSTDEDCPTGVCVDDACVLRADGGADVATEVDVDAECALTCGAACCDGGQVCFEETCAFDRGACTDSETCPDDSYCETSLGRCIGYEEDPDRLDCTLPATPGVLSPEVSCSWTAPPDGDAYPAHVEVQSMPLVVDFRFDRGPDDPARPSVVIVTGNSNIATGVPSVIRVLDGATCAQQHTLDDVLVQGHSTLALGDITGDGRPDIVGHAAAGGVVAWERAGEGFRMLWYTAEGAIESSHDLALADVDDDGTPEIIAGAYVYGADGTLRSSVGGAGASACGDVHGASIVADVDRDGTAEVVADTMIYEWSDAAGELVPEPYFTGPGRGGFVALADFGEFAGALEDGPERPEVVVVNGSVSLHTIGGEIVFGPIALPGGETGGNATIADFDGDGEPEIGVAGFTFYTLFDPRCGDPTRPGECASGRDDGILWSRSIRENSCSVMGSTVFDFEGDGRAELVYADECYLRIFDGLTGDVLWSHPSGSATWEEAPIVADVDGDFHADLVLPSVSYTSGCPAHDLEHRGRLCGSDDDCPATGGGCQMGVCRCESTDDCEDPAFDCVAPVDGSDVSGMVCRAAYRDQPVGVRIFRGRDGNWASSRPVWNQHGYFVENVGPTGVVPRSRDQRAHWLFGNNFRQNSQADIAPDAAADLTVRGESFGRDCTAAMPELPLRANACNRGALPVGPGVDVVFYGPDGAEVCRAATTVDLEPGECEEVGCTWSGAPVDTPLAITIEVDSEGAAAECRDGNNTGTLTARCPPPVI